MYFLCYSKSLQINSYTIFFFKKTFCYLFSLPRFSFVHISASPLTFFLSLLPSNFLLCSSLSVGSLMSVLAEAEPVKVSLQGPVRIYLSGHRPTHTHTYTVTTYELPLNFKLQPN